MRGAGWAGWLLWLCLLPRATAQDAVEVELTAIVEQSVQLPTECTCTCDEGVPVLTCVVAP